MNAEEAATLCRLAKTISPAQAVDEFTPAAWALVLEDHRFIDAKEALKQLGGEQEWIHVSHIVARIKRIRRDRVDDYGPLPQPPTSIDPDDVKAHRQWLAATTRAIADGDALPALEPRAELPTRNVSVLGTAGQPMGHDHRSAARAAMQDGKAAAKANEVPVRTFPVTRWHGPEREVVA